MRIIRQGLPAIAAAALLCAAYGPAPSQAKDFYKMSTINVPTPFAINTTFAKLVQKYNPDIEIQVNATGAAPRHALDAANGKTDFFMGAPSLQFFMSKKLAMFAKVKNAPELAKNLRAIFNYRIGYYQFAVYGDSGIKAFKDLKGKRVFLGPPTGVQKVIAADFVEAVSGLKAGKDYEAVKLDFGPASQAFQDRQIAMLVNASNPPAANLAQLALTNKIRLLGANDASWSKPLMQKVMKVPGRSRGDIAPDVYGKNQANDKPIQTLASWVGLVTRKDIPADVIYKMTKTFWEHLDEMHAVAPWAKDAINLKNAFKSLNMKLHPGAIRYYKEIGLKIPAVAM